MRRRVRCRFRRRAIRWRWISPAGPGIEALYARLVAITLRYGGRVYLAKDALLDVGAFRAMYPRWDAYRRLLDEVDPRRRLQSDMSRRLRLREAA